MRPMLGSEDKEKNGQEFEAYRCGQGDEGDPEGHGADTGYEHGKLLPRPACPNRSSHGVRRATHGLSSA